MRPTRLGWGCMAMAALTLLTAASTGNNLLYLLYSALASALIVAAAGGALNMRRLSLAAQPPEQVFRGAPFALELSVSNGGAWAVYGLEAFWQDSAGRLERLGAGETGRISLRGALPHRGLNSLDDLGVESAFPFGLFRHRLRPAGLTALAFPKAREARAASEVQAQARASGRPTLRKGGGEELYGVREYGPGDDARSLNWKLSARLGRPLINEYCSAHDERITVSVASSSGEGGESAIEQAASACRYHIDAGAEVRLESAEETVDYGRGLLQLDRLLHSLSRLGEGRRPRPCGHAKPLRGGAQPEDSEPLRRLTLAAAALTYAGMCLIDEVNPSLLLALSPALPLGVLVQEKRWRLLPRVVWNLMSLAVLAYMLLVDWRVTGVTVSNTHLLLYLLVNRLLNPFEAQELAQIFLILFLAFFLISGLTISLWYFPVFLLYLAAAALWLSLAGGLRWGLRRQWLGGVAACAVFGAAFSAASFTLTPRVEGLRRINPFLAAGIDKLAVDSSSVTGFTDNVSLGFFGRLKKSSARVMRLKPVPPPQVDRPGELRVRGAAFDRFDGHRWSKAPGRPRAWAARRGDQLLFPAAASTKRGPVYDIRIYPMGLSVLFTVGTPWLVEGVSDAASFDVTDSILLSSPYTGGIHYVVHPSLDAGFNAGGAGEAAGMRRFLDLPADRGNRVESLAREATAGAVDALAKVRAVERFLQKRYDYSNYSDGNSRTLEDFLFMTRKGNCEYFATAGVILLRHAGVPARLVTGFLASDWNEYGKFYDVRQGEAHAWLEAYVPGRGWLAADPTPAQSALSARAEELGRRVQHWLAAAQTEWYRHIIGYDQYVQRDTFRRLGTAFSPRALRGALRGALYALAAFGGLAALSWILAAARRRWGSKPPTPFIRAQAALARRGLKRQDHLTPREFAAWVLALRPELAAFAGLAELHYLQAYRPSGLSSAQEQEAARLLLDLRSRL